MAPQISLQTDEVHDLVLTLPRHVRVGQDHLSNMSTIHSQNDITK